MNIFINKDHVESIKLILEVEKTGNILLVTGEKSFKDSGLANAQDKLFAGRRVIHILGPGESPDYAFVLDALEKTEGLEAGLIITMGGGSTMDFAKILAIYMNNRHVFESDMANFKSLKAAAPIVAIPTTAGSGSEATQFAVMYKEGEKFSVASQEILPSYVILDPVLTYGLPPFITACSGIDAMCQAIESLWALDATGSSRKHAMQALQHLYPNIRDVVHNPSPENRKQMLTGAYYAGKAINISKTTGPHALSYYLTAHHGLQHGEAVAMNMEMFIDLNYQYLSADIQDFLKSLFGADCKHAIIKAFSELKAEIGLRQGIKDVGITSETEITTYFFSADRDRLANSPGELSPEKLLSYYLQT